MSMAVMWTNPVEIRDGVSFQVPLRPVYDPDNQVVSLRTPHLKGGAIPARSATTARARITPRGIAVVGLKVFRVGAVIACTVDALALTELALRIRHVVLGSADVTGPRGAVHTSPPASPTIRRTCSRNRDSVVPAW